MQFTHRVQGALYGIAIGDGMGAPVEGDTPEKIAARFQHVRDFLPPTHTGDPRTGKGDGRITDDTLMTEALIRAYIRHQDHFDAYDYETFLLPEIITTRVWVPERQAELPAIERLWWPEKFPWMRLTTAHADPRQAGVGNCVNCGIAMWMMPVGAVNAGDPQGAYDEAAALGLAHNESFAVEAGAVMAAAYAAAFAADAGIPAVIDAASRLARDGTRKCCDAALHAAAGAADIPSFIQSVRAAVAPFDQRAYHTPDDQPHSAGQNASDLGKPSRISSIEELPVALAALHFGAGNFDKTLHAAVFYGRDCDSIAGMAAGLFGALFGLAALPENLRTASDAANRRNFAALGDSFARITPAILEKDAARLAARRRAI